ncbi:uncharacterized protein LOC105422343 [Pogonomyrmex barbatus]|uniref:Uncharacterized protein LOC105422343 n=1 Tax=Pogonomyrmex barbatus TaxID=144034 RepID=A0A6I9VN24_9HYME|nr:uncharacterized protein LOC105422343 [Pogonomyrmex barbatus]
MGPLVMTNMAVASVARAIAAMGLEVAPHKTEAIFLYKRRRGVPPPAFVRIGLDRMMNALCRLLPNLGGPGAAVRRLYVNTVLSVLLYGAPVWAIAMAASRYIRAMANAVQRRMAARVAHAYRTVSHAAVTVLAEVPPVDLMALKRAEDVTMEQEEDSSKPRIVSNEEVLVRIERLFPITPTSSQRRIPGDDVSMSPTIGVCQRRV